MYDNTLKPLKNQGLSAVTLDVIMQRYGITPPDHIDTSGRLVRYAGNPSHPRKRDTWYVAHEIGTHQVVTFGDWRLVPQSITWRSYDDDDISDHDRPKFQKIITSQKKQYSSELKRRQEEAATKAVKMLRDAADCTGHPYLTAKHVDPVPGLKVSGDALLMPIQDIAGKIWGLQKIYPEKLDGYDSNKLFLTGTKKQGCFFPIEGRGWNTILICEGLSTGITIHRATGHTVIVALDAGNLTPVSKAIRSKYPTSTIIICGDNDRYSDGNPGATAAQAAADAVGGRYVLPEFARDCQGTDFNDLMQAEGIERVTYQIEAGAEAVEVPEDAEPEPGTYDYVIREYPIIPFPWEVFPAGLTDCIHNVAELKGIKPYCLVGAIMASLASLAAANITITPLPEFRAPLILFFADIMPSGAGKTPSLKAMATETLDQWQAEVEDAYEQELNDWKLLPKNARGPEPKQPRVYKTTQFTIEGLHHALTTYPATLAFIDEISGLFNSQNQYKSGKGDDREAILRLFDGDSIYAVRRGERRKVRNPRVSIVGGTQPYTLNKVISSQDILKHDGTIFRFCFLYEKNPAVPLRLGVHWDTRLKNKWLKLLSDFHVIGNSEKHYDLIADTEAQKYAVTLINELRMIEPQGVPEELHGFFKKCSDYIVRFSGLLSLIRQLWDSGQIVTETLMVDDLRAGYQLAQYYLHQNLNLFAGMYGAKERARYYDPETQAIAVAINNALSKNLFINNYYPIKYLLNDLSQMGVVFKSERVLAAKLRKLKINTTLARYRELTKNSMVILNEDLETLFKTISAMSAISSNPVNIGRAECGHCKTDVRKVRKKQDSDPSSADIENRYPQPTSPMNTKFEDNEDNDDIDSGKNKKTDNPNDLEADAGKWEVIL